MRKDDIIGQKLFETCKLSEFYLNLVVNCKNEDESPFQLARAYKQKLYEIVERYDRLLDANRQRQQLCLTFDNSKQQQSRKIFQESNLSLTRTSTPNKTPTVTPSGMNTLFTYATQTPTAPLTPSSSFASTPTTPYQRSQSFHNRSSFSQNGRSFIYSHNSSKYQTQQRNKQQSQQQQQQLHHSSLNKTSKLLQQYAFLYDEYDSDEEENNFYQKNKYTSKATTGIQTTTTTLLNCKLNYEAYSSTFNKLTNKTNAYNENQDETVEEYDEEDVEEEEEFSNDLSESQIIEKSYSNLSKDSGVFADSYHSDYSNCLIGIGNNNNEQSNSKHSDISISKRDKKTFKNNEDYDENSTSTSSAESNKTIDSSEEYPDQLENKTMLSHDENDTVIDETTDETTSSKLIWGSISRLVESSNFDLNNKNKFNNLNNLSSSPINASKANSEHLVKTNMKTINFEFNPTDETSMVIIDSNNRTDTNHLCADYLSCYSSSSSSSTTMSPLSTSSPTSSTSIRNSEDRTNKELKFLNTNSLMNVSMLDNIQATNTHLDFDNMNSSILMFN